MGCNERCKREGGASYELELEILYKEAEGFALIRACGAEDIGKRRVTRALPEGEPPAALSAMERVVHLDARKARGADYAVLAEG